MQGETILISAFECDYFPLTSTDVIKNFLIQSVKILGMNPILDSLTIRLFPTEDGRGDYGISGFIILTESHHSIHTWVAEKYIRVEFSSCKKHEDSEQKLKDLVRNYFGAKDIRVKKVSW